MARSRTHRAGGSVAQRGFTLLELLVVTAMIAILVTIAVVSFNLLGGDRSLQQEANRLSAIVQAVSEEAQMQGRDFGLELTLEGYRFVEFDPLFNVWVAVAGDDLLKQTELPERMEFELQLEGHRVQLPVEAKELKAPEEDDNEEMNGAYQVFDQNKRDLTDDYLPHILILASGDVSPFRLRIVRQFDDQEITLVKEVGKELEVVRDEDGV